jgi:hypothetical protein
MSFMAHLSIRRPGDRGEPTHAGQAASSRDGDNNRLLASVDMGCGSSGLGRRTNAGDCEEMAHSDGHFKCLESVIVPSAQT